MSCPVQKKLYSKSWLLAVASHLAYSSCDVIGDILIVPISNLTSAQLLRAQCLVAASAVALGAEIPPSLLTSASWDAQLQRWVNKWRQRVLLAQVLFWAERARVHTGIVCRSLYQKACVPLSISHGRSGHHGVTPRDAKEWRSLTCLLTSAMQISLPVMGSGACFSHCFCDWQEQTLLEHEAKY